MYNWFECTVKYGKTSEEGKIKKVTEKHLVDALSFTEAEERIIKEITPFVSGEFKVSGIVPKNYNEIFYNENADKWFKAKVNFIVLDENKGVEKKTPVFMLIQATDLKEAREGLEKGMKGTMADYEIHTVSETKIINVFKYEN